MVAILPRWPGASNGALFMSICDLLRVRPGPKFKLKDHDPSGTPGLADLLDKHKLPKGGKHGDETKEAAAAAAAENVRAIAALQDRLYAENKQCLLVVLQGMDTSGKDGAIRGVFSGVNPQGCKVTSFKKPTEAEADRDFLWRIHAAVPARGEIGVYNRAHYEDVLIVRVHNFVPPAIWGKRYEMINDCERYLVENHVKIIKCFLHISKDEQLERLKARLDDPAKNWKFSMQDVEERKHWAAYQQAYEAALSKCATKAAPWYIVPANRKWYRNLAISKIVRETLEAMNPRTPKPMVDLSKVVLK